jgi:hypothetical protein
MHDARATPEQRQAARTLALTSLEQRLAELERLILGIPDGSIWVSTASGLPHVNPTVIRGRIAEARRHAAARRWVAAVEAYKTAEDLVEHGRPTLRRALEHAAAEARRAAAAKRAAGLLLGPERKRRNAKDAAQDYVTQARVLRVKYPDWSLSTIIEHLRRAEDHPPSPRQIRRYLSAHGVK